MKPTGSIIAAALLAVPSHGAVSKKDSNPGFSVTQVERGQKLRSVVTDKARTFNRYATFGGSPWKNIQIGEVPAFPLQYDAAYVCPVQVGGQTLYLDFDAGSSDLWVFSSLLPKNEVGNHSLYDPNKSHSAHLEKDLSWNITYGDKSSASGVVYLDTVNVGGAVVKGQAVEAATYVSDDFTESSRDGLLGLAFDSINTVEPTPQKTFFTNILSSLPEKVFTACLKHKGPGTFDFGFINPLKYKGKLSYLPVAAASGVWQFTAGGYAIGDEDPISGSLGTAIADTGTSIVYLPTELLTAYYKQVHGSKFDNDQQGYVFPCDATLPNLRLQLGNTTIMLPGSHVNYAPINSKGTTCLGGLQESPAPGMSILGDVFFQSAFVVFDRSGDNPRIGFAQQRG